MQLKWRKVLRFGRKLASGSRNLESCVNKMCKKMFSQPALSFSSDIKNIDKYNATRQEWIKKFIYTDNPYKNDLRV